MGKTCWEYEYGRGCKGQKGEDYLGLCGWESVSEKSESTGVRTRSHSHIVVSGTKVSQKKVGNCYRCYRSRAAFRYVQCQTEGLVRY